MNPDLIIGAVVGRAGVVERLAHTAQCKLYLSSGSPVVPQSGAGMSCQAIAASAGSPVFRRRYARRRGGRSRIASSYRSLRSHARTTATASALTCRHFA
jgi:hypothetical protein